MPLRSPYRKPLDCRRVFVSILSRNVCRRRGVPDGGEGPPALVAREARAHTGVRALVAKLRSHDGGEGGLIGGAKPPLGFGFSQLHGHAKHLLKEHRPLRHGPKQALTYALTYTIYHML
eukprot:1450609-Pyramimonas_sp.AAC.1